MVRSRRGAGGQRQTPRLRGDQRAPATLPAGLLGRVGQPRADDVAFRYGPGVAARGGGTALDPGARRSSSSCVGRDGLSGDRSGAVRRHLRVRRVRLPARARAPLLRSPEKVAVQSAGARDLRRRVVGDSGGPTRTPTSRPRSRSATSTCRRLSRATRSTTRSTVGSRSRRTPRRSARRSPRTATTTRSRSSPGPPRTGSRAR